MKNKDLITIINAIKICKKYKEDTAADMLIDILDDYISADPSENTPETMTQKEADVLGDVINICDNIGKYGTGDILLDVIHKYLYREV